MHIMEEVAIGTIMLKIGEKAGPEIVNLQQERAAGKPITFAEVWDVAKGIGDGIASSKYGKMHVLEGTGPSA